jgi:hypothetical protein
VSQAEQWVFPQHPWTCISHDDLGLFAAIALVAMNRASGAGWFFSAESATVQSQTGVIHQAFAFIAKVVAMVIPTIDLDHGLDGFEFAGEPGIDFVRQPGRFQSDFVSHVCRCVHLTVRI